MDGRVFRGGGLESRDLDDGIIAPVVTGLNQSDLVSSNGEASSEGSSTRSGTNDDIVIGIGVSLCFCLCADDNRPAISFSG
jgi:hypothetical protein